MIENNLIGKSITKTDSVSKSTGKALYTDDIKLPNMLYGKLLRSPFPHARIKNINIDQASKVSGVKCIITGYDIPKIKYGNWRLFPNTQDEYPLAINKTRFIGDEIAAVAAIDKDRAEEAISLINVEYEELPAYFDIPSALKKNYSPIHKQSPNNISINRKIEYGDINKGFKSSDLICEETYNLQAVNHAYMEPCSCIAQSDLNGKITLWTSTQTPYIVQCLLASTLNIRENDVRIIKPNIGGGFGGKMELRSWEFCAAFISKKTGNPVKFTLSREEEFSIGRRRHPMVINSKIGFKKDGKITAKKLHIYLDGGAYNAMGPTATFLSGNFGAMLYRYPNYSYLGEHVYTNNPPASAMRGFGAPQTLFVSETQMNIAAEKLNIDPIEIRLKNAMISGDKIPGIATISSCGFIESLKKVEEISNWHKKKYECKKNNNTKTKKGIGIGCYSFISGGVFNWFNTQYPFSSAEIRAYQDGTVHLLTMASDIGQGSSTILKQILAESLGINLKDIRITTADTAMTPQADLGSWGSRVTLMAGNAIINAANKIKKLLFGAISAKFNLNVIFDFECKKGRVYAKGKPERGMTFGEAIQFVQKTKRGKPIVTRGYYTPRGKGLVTPAFSFGAQIAELEIDSETGAIKVNNIWTAHDCGTVINPTSVEGQLEGSIHMGLGYALSEELIMKKGQTMNKNFLDYKILSAIDMPNNISLCVETFEKEGPMGAKEAGEGLVSPTAPAICEAISNATGFRSNKLPIISENILKKLEKNKIDNVFISSFNIN